MGQAEDLQKMSALATQMARAASEGQAAALSLLLAEMNALSALLPGHETVQRIAAAKKDSEEMSRRVDAEVEASFDNMPV